MLRHKQSKLRYESETQKACRHKQGLLLLLDKAVKLRSIRSTRSDHSRSSLNVKEYEHRKGPSPIAQEHKIDTVGSLKRQAGISTAYPALDKAGKFRIIGSTRSDHSRRSLIVKVYEHRNRRSPNAREQKIDRVRSLSVAYRGVTRPRL